MVCEKLVDLDELYQQWLVAHYHLVRRTMGVDRTVHALDGLPSRVLVGRMTKPLIPSLWDVRVTLTNRWTRAGGHVPGAARCPFSPQESASQEG
jgi:tryptophan 2,3-dioxygenase